MLIEVKLQKAEFKLICFTQPVNMKTTLYVGQIQQKLLAYPLYLFQDSNIAVGSRDI